jgi:hypothetical protein
MDKCKSGKSLSCKVQILAHGLKIIKREEEKMKIIRKDKKGKIFGNLTIGTVFTTEKNELCLKVQDSDIIDNAYDLEKKKIIYVPPFEKVEEKKAKIIIGE